MLCCLRTMPRDLTCWVQGRDINTLAGAHIMAQRTRPTGLSLLFWGWNSGILTSARSDGSVGGM